MEKPIFPSKYMRITQGYQEGSHKDSFAIDNAGKNSEIEQIQAPYTGIIKKIYPNDANEVWLESVNEVEYPDGTIDYMTIMFAHANDISELFVGKRIEQGEVFYNEGTKGNATGNHCHIECGKGKFTGSGWHKTTSGYYSINNSKKPEDCLWIDDSITIINSNNYIFKKIVEELEPEENNNQPDTAKDDSTTPNITPPVSEEKDSEQQEQGKKPEEEQPIFICQEKGLYGIYLDKGQKVYIK